MEAPEVHLTYPLLLYHFIVDNKGAFSKSTIAGFFAPTSIKTGVLGANLLFGIFATPLVLELLLLRHYDDGKSQCIFSLEVLAKTFFSYFLSVQLLPDIRRGLFVLFETYFNSFFRIDMKTAAGFLAGGIDASRAKSITLRKTSNSLNLPEVVSITSQPQTRRKQEMSEMLRGGIIHLSAFSRIRPRSETLFAVCKSKPDDRILLASSTSVIFSNLHHQKLKQEL
jgi:hypothetical protein